MGISAAVALHRCKDPRLPKVGKPTVGLMAAVVPFLVFISPKHLVSHSLFSKHWRHKGNQDTTPVLKLEGRQSYIQITIGRCDGNCSSREKGQAT